jgi:hypothetical protein
LLLWVEFGFAAGGGGDGERRGIVESGRVLVCDAVVRRAAWEPRRRQNMVELVLADMFFFFFFFCTERAWSI